MYRVIHNNKVVYESYDLEDCEDFIDYEIKQDGCTIEHDGYGERLEDYE